MMRAGMATLLASTILGGSDQDLAVTAAGTTSQANSYALKSGLTTIATCAINNGVVLPTDCSNGDSFVVCNKGANQCLLYPPSGGQLNGQAADIPLVIPARNGVVHVRSNSNLLFTVSGHDQESAVPVAGGTSLTLTAAAHAGKTILLSSATATAITLPAATGSMCKYKFIVSAVPSGSHTITCAGSDKLQGIISTMSDDAGAAVKAYAAVAGTSTVITLNHGTTGGVTVGEEITLTDVAAARWHVAGVTTSTGTEATPFS